MTSSVLRTPHEQLEHLTVAERNARDAKLSSYADRPLAFLLSYIRRHPFAHAIVLTGELQPYANFLLKKGVIGEALAA